MKKYEEKLNMDHGTWNMEVCNYGAWNVGYSREGFSNFNSCSYCFELVLVKLKQITLVHTWNMETMVFQNWLWMSDFNNSNCGLLVCSKTFVGPKIYLNPKFDLRVLTLTQSSLFSFFLNFLFFLFIFLFIFLFLFYIYFYFILFFSRLPSI